MEAKVMFIASWLVLGITYGKQASDQARPWGAPQSPELWGSPRDGQLQAVKAISSAPKARPPSTGQLPSEGLSRKVSDQARPWGAPQSPELWGSSRDGQLQAVKAISSARKARPPCSGQLPSQGLSRKVSDQARPWGAPQSPGLWGSLHDGQLQARPPCTDQLPSQGLPRKVSGKARPWGAPQSPGLWGSPHDGQLQAVKAMSSAQRARRNVYNQRKGSD